MNLWDVIAGSNAPQSTQMFNQMGLTRQGNTPKGSTIWHSTSPLTHELKQQYHHHLKENGFKPVNVNKEGDSYHAHPSGSTASIHNRSYNGGGTGHYVHVNTMGVKK